MTSLSKIIMKEKGHYWKHVSDDKDISSLNFTFDTFLLTLQIIATYGFKNLKEDLSSRMLKLFKHIYKIMSTNEKFNESMNTSKSTKSKSRSPGTMARDKNIITIDAQDKSKRALKDSADIYLMSNRSGGSTKSSHGKNGSNQLRKNKKRRSSNQKRRLK